ncbi:MAG: 3-dehydroquinate synthase [Frankiales bacterium]|jgi:3-dehydroquinate synthase|nr:3-dehydroquinate synthase [Frankiales bacterium]
MTASTTRILVGGPAPYDVVVGNGLDGEIATMVDGASVVALIHPRTLTDRAARLASQLGKGGLRVEVIPVPDGETAKELVIASEVWDMLAEARVSRTDAVIGFGGGATTDLAGFVAATWLRGVRVVQVPTTLLGMVDAAVGGKTAVNTRAGKNLVGVFHPPAGVICDISTLSTLPPHEYVSGLAEVIKAGFIADPGILDIIESDPAAATRHDGPQTRELIERAIRVKADVVAADLTEQGGREMLNYGHTLAHAIEKVEDFRGRHGPAVSVGLVYAAAVGRLAGRLDDDTAARHRATLAAVGLPTTYATDAWPRLYSAMNVDKKVRGGRLRFVVLDGLGKPGILDDPDTELLESAYAEVAT